MQIHTSILHILRIITSKPRMIRTNFFSGSKDSLQLSNNWTDYQPGEKLGLSIHFHSVCCAYRSNMSTASLWNAIWLYFDYRILFFGMCQSEGCHKLLQCPSPLPANEWAIHAVYVIQSCQVQIVLLISDANRMHLTSNNVAIMKFTKGKTAAEPNAIA